MSRSQLSSPKFEASNSNTSNDQVFEQLIVEESASLRRSILVYQIVGRILFTAIVLLVTFLQPPTSRQLPLAIFIILLGAVWLIKSFIISRRSKLISRLIAEADYSDYSNWVSLFVKSHHHRYEDRLGVLFTELHLLEPVLWVVLSIWLLAVAP